MQAAITAHCKLKRWARGQVQSGTFLSRQRLNISLKAQRFMQKIRLTKPIRRVPLKIHKHVLNTTLMVAVFSLAMMSVPVFAAHENACKDDIAKFCGSVDPKDHKAIKACLTQHQSEVSPDCQKHMAHKHKKKSGSSESSGTSAAPASGTAQ
jgi:hypothetical protein